MELFKNAIESMTEDMPPLAFPVGKAGREYAYMDLSKAPHVLFAGETGSGKSVGLNDAIATIMLRAGHCVRFHMIDPKRVELADYADAKSVARVVTDMDEAAEVIDALVAEMDERYELMMEAGVKKLADYNKTAETPLPHEVLVVDELGDLMDTHSKQVLPQLIRLGQLARAAGIHMMLATQRPAADTIPKRLLSNIPARIAYKCQSFTESRLVLGEKGAEALHGNGHLMAKIPGTTGFVTAQSPYITEDEIREIVSTSDGPEGIGAEMEADEIEEIEDETVAEAATPTLAADEVRRMVSDAISDSAHLVDVEAMQRDHAEAVEGYEAALDEMREKIDAMRWNLAAAHEKNAALIENHEINRKEEWEDHIRRREAEAKVEELRGVIEAQNAIIEKLSKRRRFWIF